MDPTFGDEMLKAAIAGDVDDLMWLDEDALLCGPLLPLAHLPNTFECDIEPADNAPPPSMSTIFNSPHVHEEDEEQIIEEQHLTATPSCDENDGPHKMDGCDDDAGLAILSTSSTASPPTSPPLPIDSAKAATNEPMTTTKKVVLRLFGSGFTANHLREQHPEYSELIGQHFGTWLQLKDRTYANKGYLEHVIDQQVDRAYSYDNTKAGGASPPRLLTKSELLDSMKQRMRDEKSKMRKQEKKKKSAFAETKTTTKPNNGTSSSCKKLRKLNKTSLSTTSSKKRTATICYGGGDSSGSYDDQGHFSYELGPPRFPPTNKKYKVVYKKTPPMSLEDHYIAAPPPPPFLIRNSTSYGTIVSGHGHNSNTNENDYIMVDPSSMLLLLDDSFLADDAVGGDERQHLHTPPFCRRVTTDSTTVAALGGSTSPSPTGARTTRKAITVPSSAHFVPQGFQDLAFFDHLPLMMMPNHTTAATMPPQREVEKEVEEMEKEEEDEEEEEEADAITAMSGSSGHRNLLVQQALNALVEADDVAADAVAMQKKTTTTTSSGSDSSPSSGKLHMLVQRALMCALAIHDDNDDDEGDAELRRAVQASLSRLGSGGRVAAEREYRVLLLLVRCGLVLLVPTHVNNGTGGSTTGEGM